MDYPIHIYDSTTAGKPVLCIAHANGFPPHVYSPLINAIDSDFHAVCLPSRPWWEGSDPDAFTSWETLIDDLIAGIRAHHLAPIVGVGHSMGGVMMTVAAVRHPELFRAVIMLDPVYPPRFWTRAVRIAKRFGYRPLKRLEDGALKRRRQWDSVEDAYARFRKRSLLARCSDEVVHLYVEGMTHPAEDGEGIELAYSPEWEAAIFRNYPLYAWRYPSQLHVPTLIIGGGESDTFLPLSSRLLQRMNPDFQIERVPETGHLVPLEKPDVVAEHIRTFLKSHTGVFERG